jgi:hypothetical protein
MVRGSQKQKARWANRRVFSITQNVTVLHLAELPAIVCLTKKRRRQNRGRFKNKLKFPRLNTEKANSVAEKGSDPG